MGNHPALPGMLAAPVALSGFRFATRAVRRRYSKGGGARKVIESGDGAGGPERLPARSAIESVLDV